MTKPTSPISLSGIRLANAVKAFPRRIAAALGGWIIAVRHRRAVADLLALDDYMLRDIGVSRQDVESALATPMYRDASWRLAERAIASKAADRARAEQGLRWARLMQEASNARAPEADPAAREKRPRAA
jgi:uncharacterized protein YjiS (DUF1127 family)